MFVKSSRHYVSLFIVSVAALTALLLASPLAASAAVDGGAGSTPAKTAGGSGGSSSITPCGSSASGTQYTPSIDLGCKGKGNAIMDFLFAAIRFLSAGVGIVLVASMVYAGIQYTGSRGDPNADAQAVKRIQANITALLLFVFAYAILNYVVPGAFLK